MIVVLDFDRVLFDVDRYKKDIVEHGDGALIGTRLCVPKYPTLPYLFGDVTDFFSKLDGNTAYIVTSTKPELGPVVAEYQHMKVEGTGVHTSVRSVYYVGESKIEALHEIAHYHKDEKVVFIDDLLYHLNQVSLSIPQIALFQMRRPTTRLDATENSLTEVSRVESLHEVVTALSL
jgi:hypothetical protein